uniref:hypothetical protein n=1 Tax=Prevotella denticola TaxID=28129 RepID=UPI0022DEA160
RECSSYFQLLCDSEEFEVLASIIRILILPFKEKIVLLYSLACVNMSKILQRQRVKSEKERPPAHTGSLWSGE